VILNSGLNQGETFLSKQSQESVRVIVRCRPLIEREKHSNERNNTVQIDKTIR
jgi:hypothetical protein